MAKLEQVQERPAVSAEDFNLFQKEHFVEAEQLRFRWQTGNPVIKAAETALLTELFGFLGPNTRLLEVGCGEGANLVNLPGGAQVKLAIGADFSQNKSAFWMDSTRRAGTTQACSGLCADATRLPLASQSFDLVFCRDLLHHIAPEQQAQVIAEMFRVCRPGGKVLLIESNGRNPIIFLHALLIKAERGEWKSSPALFKRLLLEAGGQNLQMKGREPMPVFRLALHYRFGFPGLGRQSWVARAFQGLDKVISWLLPWNYWAYVVAWVDVPQK